MLFCRFDFETLLPLSNFKRLSVRLRKTGGKIITSYHFLAVWETFNDKLKYLNIINYSEHVAIVITHLQFGVISQFRHSYRVITTT
jgi:hypothetical protein